MDFEKIMEAVKADEGVKTKLTEALLDGATLEEMVNKRDPRIAPALDKLATKAISSFKEKGMQSILDEKKKEYFNEFAKEHNLVTDPKEKALMERIKDLEAKQAEIEAQKTRASAQAELSNFFSEKKLPLKLAEFTIEGDLESSKTKAEKLSVLIEATVDERVKARLKENDTTPGSGKPDYSEKNPFSKEHFNLTKQAELLEKDPVRAKELQKLAKK